MDYPNRERKGWEVGNKGVEKVSGTEGKGAETFAQRSGTSGECLRMHECVFQEEKGIEKTRNCMCALTHICGSVCMQVYLFMGCIFLCVSRCGRGWMCAERDVCT